MAQQLPRQGADEDRAARAGVPCARHRAADERRRGLVASSTSVGYPVVLKPTAGAGAKSTFRVADAGEMRAALASVRPSARARQAVVEEFVAGDEFSFDTVSIRGRPVWHSLSYYLPAPLNVVDNPWIQWCVLIPREIDHPRFDDIRRVAFRALEVARHGHRPVAHGVVPQAATGRCWSPRSARGRPARRSPR